MTSDYWFDYVDISIYAIVTRHAVERFYQRVLDAKPPQTTELTVKAANYLLEQVDGKLVVSGMTGKIPLADWPNHLAVISNGKIITVVTRDDT